MRKLCLVVTALCLLSSSVLAGTVTITAATFAALPPTAPANWPPGVAYPAGGTVNGTKTVTISDADTLKIITWIAANQTPQGQGPPVGQPTVVTAIQLVLNWINTWFNGTQQGVQVYHTTPAVVPPPISIQ